MKRTPYHPSHEPDSLGSALRALPAQHADADTWRQIRRRAEAKARRRRRLRTGMPLAMAASVLIAFGVGYALRMNTPAPLASDTKPAHARITVTHNGAMLAQLQNHSMRLEQWLGELRANGAPLQGQALASAVNLQDRIGLIDLQLAAPGTSGDRQTLWRQRIRLLQDLAMLRVSQSPISDRPVMAENRHPTYHL
jgi:hypothetical protein